MDDRCIFVTGASSDIGTELLNSIGDNYSLIYAHYRNDSENFGFRCRFFVSQLSGTAVAK